MYNIVIMEVLHMKYSLESIEALLAPIKDMKEIDLADIPCIDLYMDQVTTLFDERLSPQKRNEEDVVLTKTMINNYAKAKILPPIKNKKYNKQQIILLILIYNLKQVLSLEDIKSIFEPILSKLSQDPSETEFLDDIYNKFLTEKQELSGIIIDDFISKLKNSTVNPSDSEDNILDLLMKVLVLVSCASIQKRMAEKIIDTYFKDQEKP
ncbi:MAG TPA: hypothetical protein DGK91_12785 [Clostridium sp.]|jgi:hypothetical protein|nr:hypothetical protein [Clostridium sp.]